MISITWHNKHARGCRDDLPPSWFTADADQPRAQHWTTPLGSAAIPAVCSVRLDGRHAYLDYGGEHESENAAQEVYPDRIRLTFADDARSELLAVEWPDDRTGDYVPCPATWTDLRDLEAAEGDTKLVKHLLRERDASLRDKKIAAENNDQRCRVCGFSFTDVYGIEPYCEMHHEDSLKEGPRMTGLDRLVILCANCHRAIHRVRPMPSVAAFRARYEAFRSPAD